jgi:uncharacterized iron-regulated membrane protein
MLRWALQLHKWIALVVGIQVLFWVGGGLVMTAIPIGKVRGEHQAKPVDSGPIPLGTVMSPADIVAKTGFKAPNEAILKMTPQGPIWVLRSARGSEGYYAAATGDDVRELTPDEASKAAASAFTGPGKPVRATLLDDVVPEEADATAPLYLVEFDDKDHTHLYLDAFTGEVLSRRSDTWRFYDFFWRLHAMDWKTGNNFNHPLIVATTAVTLFMVLTGFVLLWIRLARDLATVRARK